MITVRQAEFDKDDLLVNTPAGVFDITTKKLRPHTVDDLMLMQTRFGPLMSAFNLPDEDDCWRLWCSRWIEYINFLASMGESGQRNISVC